MKPPHRRRALGGAAALAAVFAAATVTPAATATEHDSDHKRPTPRPTVVLVHGGFADASNWNGVVERLQDKGYPVLAPANPLRA
ncbi:hypothetical protein ACFCXH_26820 [Streptomyces nojiriensis]|uniref:hypothetical protein n=1 Tax=Streptomyces nojiriensis TaxID=66374 RepID=UPI0035E20C2D